MSLIDQICHILFNVNTAKFLPWIRNIAQGSGHQWLTPVILAIWEAEIRRIMVGGHPGQ
jgi:hypothetical protein